MATTASSGTPATAARPRGAARSQPSLPRLASVEARISASTSAGQACAGLLETGALLAAGRDLARGMPNPWPGVYGDRAVGSVTFGRPCARMHSAARTPAWTSCGGAGGSRIGLSRPAAAISVRAGLLHGVRTDWDASWKLRLSL